MNLTKPTLFSYIRMALAAGLVTGAAQSDGATTADFKDYSYYLRSGTTSPSLSLPGRLFVPPVHDPTNTAAYNPNYPASPLVIFYHGSGQCGTDNLKQIDAEIDNLLLNAKSRPFFIFAPQTPSINTGWNTVQVENSLIMVARAVRDYKVDRTKIWVTGLSMGGHGVYTTLSDFRDVMSAALAISPGSGTTNILIPNLVYKPIWIWHSRDDASTNAEGWRSRERVNEIRRAEGKPDLRYPLNTQYVPGDVYYNNGDPYHLAGDTYYNEDYLRHSELTGSKHNIWRDVYADKIGATYDWILDKSSGLRPPEAGETILIDFGNARYPGLDPQGRYWNSTATGWDRTLDAAVSFALTTGGRRTSVVADVTSAFNNHSADGITAGAPYPPEIALDGWSTKANATETLNPGVITLRGLRPGWTYHLKLWGSTAASNRLTRYKVNASFVDLNCTGNSATTVQLNNLVADANGVLALKVFATPGGSPRYGQINVLELTAAQTPPSADLAGFGLTGINIGTGSSGEGKVLAGGNLEVTGAGSGILGNSDSFHSEFSNWTGDFRLQVRLRSFSSSVSGARAGLMIRESNSANSRMAFLGGGTGGVFTGGERTVAGAISSESSVGTTLTYPNVWLMLERLGSTIRYSVSPDGISYTEVKVIRLDGLSATVTAGLFAASSQAVLSNFQITSLVTPGAHWKLDETAGNAVADSAGTASGTVNGAAQWVAGMIKGALRLNGVDNWVEILAGSNSLFSGSKATVSLWFKPAALDTSARGLISKRAGVGNQTAFSIFTYTDKKIHVDIGSGNRVMTSYVPGVARWHHLALVFDGTDPKWRLKLYIDGGLKFRAQPTPTSIANTTANLFLGILNAGDPSRFNGEIDQVRFFNKALTEREVESMQMFP